MSYISSKDLSGNEARTGVARTEKQKRDAQKDEVLNLARKMAAEIVKEEKKKKKAVAADNK